MKKIMFFSILLSSFSICIDYKTAPSARKLFNKISEQIEELNSQTNSYLSNYGNSIKRLPDEIIEELDKKADKINDIIETDPKDIQLTQWSPFKQRLLQKLNETKIKKYSAIQREEDWGSNWSYNPRTGQYLK